MKKAAIIYVLFLAILISSCGNKEDDPTSEPVSGSLLFDSTGVYNISIDAMEISANITIIGGGGGGGGGIHHNGNVNNSTGGGGGGGAGEVVTLSHMHLEPNTLYTITVGKGGQGGVVGSNGTDGEASSIVLNTMTIQVAASGKGGKSNPPETITGGDGGTGNPSGTKGSNGEISGGITPEAKPGSGGAGGDNGSIYGSGGNGGTGSEIKTGTTINAFPGTNGSHGLVQIDWTGKR